MRKLKFVLDRKSLQTIYFTFVRPILEYSDIIWDNCTQYEKDELDKIQLEAARIVSGTTKLVSSASLYMELGWESLSSRRREHKLVMFYKMINGLCPDYLAEMVPERVSQFLPTIFGIQMIILQYELVRSYILILFTFCC